MSLIEQIFENNRAWVKSKREGDPGFFERLAREQHPEILYIGCADSRVPANEIMGLEPGDVFVHRNVANLVHPIDSNVNAVLQYAVTELRVKHIVVCGHYGCGGVKAAMQSEDLGLLNKWLRGVRDVYRLHEEELDAIGDEDKRYRRLVELNIYEQCLNVIKTSWVQRFYLKSGYPTVHGWVYDLRHGELIDLEVPFERMVAKVRRHYALAPAED